MSLTATLIGKIKSGKVSLITIYPVIIILFIPALLVFNTYWNLRSFNRDANFIVRHQAVSVGDTLKPLLEKNENPDDLQNILSNLEKSNEDIVSITLFNKEGDGFNPIASSLGLEQAKTLSGFQLNQMAVSFKEPFAALTYSPTLQRKIWNVVSPLNMEDGKTYLLNFQMDTKSINEILRRTSTDSLVILLILVVIILILLANHFYFYLRSLKTKQLEEIDRLKDEFISMAAHELRAPITAITGYLDLLKDSLTSGNSKLAADNIDVITSLTKDLNGLVEELLDVSRIEQGRLKVEAKDININEVIQKVVTVMLPWAKAKGLELNFTPIELPPVKTDPDRLRQVVTNLVSNSLKYTLKGKVEIVVVKEEKDIKISIKDTGIGIPPEHMQKLFGKFHRVQDKQTTEVRGTGLGLWITKQIVELLGGKIAVESIYGTGTSFSFTLPVV